MKINSKQKSGFTIIEVMISISIFTLSLGAFSLLLVRSLKSNSYTLEMGQSVQLVSQGVNKIGNYIRGARQGDDGSYTIVSANDNDLVLYSDYDKDGITERLHFYKSGTTILMGVRKPTTGMPKTYASGDATTVTIASNIVNTTSQSVFAYYNQNYPGDTTNNPMTTPANVANLRLVRIDLHINIDPNRPPDNIQIRTFIEMRNLSD